MKNTFWSFLAFLFCFWPLWVFLLLRTMMHPSGFWQQLVVAGLGLWFLGALQVVFAVIFVIALIGIWDW